jgi:hypothetical protein
MCNWEDDYLPIIRQELQKYQKRYRPVFDYVRLLDMDDGEFDRAYIHPPAPDLNDPQVREFIYGPE